MGPTGARAVRHQKGALTGRRTVCGVWAMAWRGAPALPRCHLCCCRLRLGQDCYRPACPNRSVRINSQMVSSCLEETPRPGKARKATISAGQPSGTSARCDRG